jgi:hypothetical protein
LSATSQELIVKNMQMIKKERESNKAVIASLEDELNKCVGKESEFVTIKEYLTCN